MNFAAAGFIHFFRIPADKSGEYGETAIIEKDAADTSPGEKRYILCRQCRQAIAKPDDRVVMQGSHRHTFANPHGIVFEIGCFQKVIGCGCTGSASDEFSWFAGHSWTVCFCTGCLTHLGWMFSLEGRHIFYGLILDRLIETE